MKRLFTAHALLLVACGLTLSGCKGGMKAMEMTVRGATEMNNGGNAAVVRIYQLSGDSNFMRTTLESFWRNDEQALGAELIAPKQEILLYPDQERALDLNIGAETRYIGIAADLRAPDPTQWRKVFDAQELRGKKVVVTIGSDRLNVSY
jgi:type VI secretion system VasD/TssJ family lipoprotein